MQVHVLPGDSLTSAFADFGFEGKAIVCRECLIDGDVSSEGLEDFWEKRKLYLGKNYSDSKIDYDTQIRDEFIELWNIADGNEVVMWFEREAFCQVNLWFTIWLIRNTNGRFSIAYPKLNEGDSPYKAFSDLSAEDLKATYEERIRLNHDDVFLAVQLWEAYQKGDKDELLKLGETESDTFLTLKAVTEALTEINTRPREFVSKMVKEGHAEFSDVYKEFCKSHAVYGLGDLQFKGIFDEAAGKIKN